MNPASRMPVVFVGHGSPMNAIDDNLWSHGWSTLGRELPRPEAILSVSAHWYTPGTYLTGQDQPPTIHDFGGFPRALFEVEYPARGHVDLAGRVAGMLADRRASLRSDWGLDHGTWSVLRHLRPAADVPVIQLSIDRRLPPAEHVAIGRALAPLRDQGVMILASGNVTHNLRHAMRHLGDDRVETPPWAASFDTDVSRALVQHDHDFLTRALDSDVGRAAHPSPDHYLPLLYAAGAADRDDAVGFPVAGFDAGSLSMRSVRFDRGE